VKGLDAFPRKDWPDNVPLLYYAYHIMAGLGTILAAVMGLTLLFLWRGRLFSTPWLLWLIMLSAPFPYIATTAGWMTAELGRQPWLVQGLLRTADGISPLIHSGNALFTLLGFLGLYLLLGLLFLFLIRETIMDGPMPSEHRSRTHEVAHSV
jgi:cytochrome d ubiquinol oxidase subunit I